MMEMIRDGDLWTKQYPLCPVHGRMRLRGLPPSLLFSCAGFDGEGCSFTVDGDDIPWTYIGRSE